MNGTTPRGYISTADGTGGLLFNASTLVENSVTTSLNVIAAVISSGSQLIFRNGTQQSSNTRTLTAGTSDTLTIGRWNPGATEYYQGDLAEMIVYSRNLTPIERQQVEGYLAWKWGLQGSLPSGQLFRLFRTPTTLFNPLLIANCLLWLDGADGSTVTLSGASVTQWNDKSGNGRNTNSVGTVAPTYVTGRGVSFSGGANSGMAGPMSITGTTLTVFVAFTFNATQSSGSSFNRIAAFSQPGVIDFTGVSRCAAIIQNDTAFSLRNQRNNALGNPTGTFTAGSIFQGCTVYDGTNVITYLNGVGGTASASSGTFGITQYLLTNATSTYSAFLGTVGVMSEMITYSTALTTVQRQRVEGYLAWKWGLQTTLPNNHPYYVAIA
jgi:hypothetical protein